MAKSRDPEEIIKSWILTIKHVDKFSSFVEICKEEDRPWFQEQLRKSQIKLERWQTNEVVKKYQNSDSISGL